MQKAPSRLHDKGRRDRNRSGAKPSSSSRSRRTNQTPSSESWDGCVGAVVKTVQPVQEPDPDAADGSSIHDILAFGEPSQDVVTGFGPRAFDVPTLRESSKRQ